eukprot:TRINITY_DN31269_c0_g1_i1.p1 TRINITY_DN31269_c0_g1~~TRINITY_DN31269_c0_g1_i1.p1  ORF type:complete len:153 (-),score=9.31 TRINITY_DN31269_c0_g1_i1:340-798(-)
MLRYQCLPGSKTLLICESCGKKYEAANEWGLHVCSECTKRGGPAAQPKQEPVMRPMGITCYVCGREFFKKSIQIHLPQCLKKRAIEQAKLPPELRTTLRDPATANPDRPLGKKLTREELNELNYQTDKANMVPCEYCGRTFSGQDRLAIHHR